MTFTDQPFIDDSAPKPVSDLYLADEQTLVRRLCDLADSGERSRAKICKTAAGLVRAVRSNSANESGIEAFLQQYDLSSEEGILLMCVAEALLRIPDRKTADRLIADKITSANWKEHLGESDSLFVNASTWGLMLTGQILNLDEVSKGNPTHYLGKLASRAGEPVVRTAMRQAMKIMGHQFVMGRTIDEALARSRKGSNRDYRYSFESVEPDNDMNFGASYQCHIIAGNDIIYIKCRNNSILNCEQLSSPFGIQKVLFFLHN
jgi:RHH-type proline utilization regulon transcriptional repressor/proline dehydrogenase/delta 1-pyrroline-5-carboxylate dehydrogenase